MSNKYNYKRILERPDEFTTAERSLLNARDIETLENKYSFLTEAIDPQVFTFSDGTLVDTQATKAEDIVSVEDIRLQGEIDLKVDTTTYAFEQGAQDDRLDAVELTNSTQQTQIDTNTTNIASLDSRVSVNETNISTIQGDITLLEGEQGTQNNRLDALEAANTVDSGRLDALEANDTIQDDRLDSLETNDAIQDTDIDNLQANDIVQDADIDALQANDIIQDGRLDAMDLLNIEQNGRLTTVEEKNVEQDDRLDSVEAVNITQDGEIDLLQSEIVRLDTEQDVQDGNISANLSKNNQQDARLDQIEAQLAAVGSDYSLLTARTNAVINDTVQIIQPIINKDFEEGGVAVNIIDDITTELTTQVVNDSTVEFQYYFNVLQATGSLVTITIELFNVTTSTIIDSATTVADFGGSIEAASGTRTVIGEVSAGDIIAIRYYTDTGNSVTTTQASGKLEVTTRAGGLDIVQDTNVLSTNSFGNVNVFEDMEEIFGLIGPAGTITNNISTIFTTLDTKADEADIWDAGGNVKIGNRNWSPVFTTGQNGQPDIINTAGLHMLRWINGGVEFGDASAAGPFKFLADREADFRISGKNPLQVRNTGLWINSLKDQTGALANIYDVFSLKSDVASDISDIQNDITDLENNKADITLVNQLLDQLIPVGTLQLGVTAPTYGTWISLGTLGEGQSIIGGSTSNGENIAHSHSLTMNPHGHTLTMNPHSHSATFTGSALPGHNHRWLRKFTGDKVDSLSSGSSVGMYEFDSYDSAGNGRDYTFPNKGRSSGNAGEMFTNKISAGTPSGTVSNSSTTSTGTIASTTSTGTIGSNGGSYNKAWGLGLGANVQVWKRTA